TSMWQLALYRQRKRLEMEAGPDPVGLWQGLETEPGLHAAALIENAERARLSRDREIAERSLNEAYEVIRKNELDQLFDVRWRHVAELIEGYRGPLKTGAAPSSEEHGSAGLEVFLDSEAGDAPPSEARDNLFGSWKSVNVIPEIFDEP